MNGLLTIYIIILMNIDYNSIMIIDQLICKYRGKILQACIIDAGQPTFHKRLYV